MSESSQTADAPGVAGIGAYAPRLRIDADAIEAGLGRFGARGVDRKAVPEADEDALTMACEAARRALVAAGRDGADLRHLAFATTTPPVAEEDLTPRLASVLGAPASVRTRTLTGSTRAGGQALDAALAAGPWDRGVGLVVAADCPRGAPDDAVEHAAGAGAAAVVLADGGPGTVVDRASHVDPYPGTRLREAGATETTGLGITAYDREAFAGVVAGAADDVDADGVDAAAIQAPDGDLPYRGADALGVDREAVAEVAGDLGDAGAASAFLGAARAVDGGAERVLLATWGSGAGADLFVLDGLDGVPVDAALDGDVDLTYPEYLRRRGALGGGEPEGGGAYVSVPSWQRTLPQRHRLVAGACECGALAFPPEGACRDCGDRPEYDPVELPGTGTVEATTTVARGGAPPEFHDQQARSGPYDCAVVALDGPDGDRTVSAPAQVIAPGDSEVSVGDRVEATIRRVYEQEGVIRYGFKMALADAQR